jgi:hypothetical protein
MSPVAAPADQRFANQFAFDSGNRMPHKLANCVKFSYGEFRITKERLRHNRSFRTKAIAHYHLP